jgi:Fe-S-cluster containining protein
MIPEKERENMANEDEEYAISEEERAFMKEWIERLMEKGIFVVYGDESDGGQLTEYEPEDNKEICKAVCCSFVFALTKKDVEKRIVRWNPKKPYFIARDADGYCSHLDRKTFMCSIWKDRPERCRNYDCRKDPNVWIDWEKEIINKDIFDHLPK